MVEECGGGDGTTQVGGVRERLRDIKKKAKIKDDHLSLRCSHSSWEQVTDYFHSALPTASEEGLPHTICFGSISEGGEAKRVHFISLHLSSSLSVHISMPIFKVWRKCILVFTPMYMLSLF